MSEEDRIVLQVRVTRREKERLRKIAGEMGMSAFIKKLIRREWAEYCDKQS